MRRETCWTPRPIRRRTRESRSSLLVAFTGMPHLETPVKSPGRVLQLRIYESPSGKTGQKKIEMFNDAGEIAIFRDVGLNPGLLWRSAGRLEAAEPDLHAGVRSDEQRKANWKKFVSDPRWAALKKMDEYADREHLVEYHQHHAQARRLLADLRPATRLGE